MIRNNNKQKNEHKKPLFGSQEIVSEFDSNSIKIRCSQLKGKFYTQIYIINKSTLFVISWLISSGIIL